MSSKKRGRPSKLESKTRNMEVSAAKTLVLDDEGYASDEREHLPPKKIKKLNNVMPSRNTVRVDQHAHAGTKVEKRRKSKTLDRHVKEQEQVVDTNEQDHDDDDANPKKRRNTKSRKPLPFATLKRRQNLKRAKQRRLNKLNAMHGMFVLCE